MDSNAPFLSQSSAAVSVRKYFIGAIGYDDLISSTGLFASKFLF